MEIDKLNDDNDLYLDPEALLKINELCGSVFSKELSFGLFDTMDTDRNRTGFQVTIIQYSSGWINRINAESRETGNLFGYMQMNPEKRFSVFIRKFSPAGVFYLNTCLSLDPCGKVLDIGRRWSQDPVSLKEGDEKARTVYRNDPFKEKILSKGPLKHPAGFVINDDEAAREYLTEFSGIVKGGGLLALSPDDPYHPYDMEGTCRAYEVTGFGRNQR